MFFAVYLDVQLTILNYYCTNACPTIICYDVNDSECLSYKRLLAYAIIIFSRTFSFVLIDLLKLRYIEKRIRFS